MSRSTPNTVNGTERTKIRRLGTICLVLAVLIAGLVVASGAAAAHPSPDTTSAEDPGKYHGDNYEHGVEDHGYYPAEGVQEGVLSDGYGGYMGGL